MSKQQTFEEKMKVISLLRWAAPTASLVFAVITYVVLDGDLKVIVPSALVVIAVLEIFSFRIIANNMERQAQKDRG